MNPSLRLLVVPLLLLAAAIAGCDAPPPPPPKKAKVTGTVTLDKAPMADGKVYFVNPGGPPDVLNVKDGNFAGDVTVGEHRVEVVSLKKQPAPKTATGGVTDVEVNIVADEFSGNSKLTAAVTEAGPNEVKLEVTSKK